MSSNCSHDRLSEYIDGELTIEEQTVVEGHVAECPGCAKVLGELRRVVRRAEALDDRPPGKELWAGVAARIGASVKPDGTKTERPVPTPVISIGSRARRFAFSVPQLLAASIALVVISGSTVWLAVQNNTGQETSPPTERLAESEPLTIPAAVRTPYDDAAADLVRILESERDQLAPETIRAIEENLTIIDNAVARAREALANDPQSDYLREHLTQTMRQKLMLLRRVTSITNAS